MSFCRVFGSILAFSLPFWVPQASAAQTGTTTQPARFTLRGTVMDPARSAVPGATITVGSEGERSSFSASVVTDATGAFELRLDPGRYSVAVTLAGFVDIEQPLTMPPNDVSQNFVLEIA